MRVSQIADLHLLILTIEKGRIFHKSQIWMLISCIYQYFYTVKFARIQPTYHAQTWHRYSHSQTLETGICFRSKGQRSRSQGQYVQKTRFWS